MPRFSYYLLFFYFFFILCPQTNDLMAIPTQKPVLSAAKILTTLGVAGVGAAVISGIYLKLKK